MGHRCNHRKKDNSTMKKAIHQAASNGKRRVWSLLAAILITLTVSLISPVGEVAKGEGDVLAAPPSVGASSEETPISTLHSPNLSKPGVLLGVYTSSNLQTTAREIGQINGWLKKNGLQTRVAIAGTFMDIEFPNPEWNIPHDLQAGWGQGAVPFVNLAVGTTQFGPRSAADVANGVIDDAIRRWATIFARWSQGGSKRAFIAPLQEMNGYWVPYGLDAENYKKAFTHIQDIFAEQGVPSEAVMWVFAPNGWSQPGHEFEKYYPGDAVVDVVAFSAFNFGACVPSGQGWDSYEVAIQPYLERMAAMAPDKPIFLAQTGSVAEGGDREQWLKDSFAEMVQVPMLKGIIYFNVAKPELGAPSCNPVDWRVYKPENGSGEQGFIEALRTLEAEELSNPQDMSNHVFIPMVVR
jgi:hypothetical protein